MVALSPPEVKQQIQQQAATPAPVVKRPAPPTKKQWDHATVDTHMAMCKPAVRMLVITSSWKMPDGPIEHDQFEVVAILTVVRHGCIRRASERINHFWYGSVKQAEEDGFHYDGSETHFVPLIVDEGRIQQAGDDWLCPNAVMEVVAAPWPASQDARRLAPILAGCEERAKSFRAYVPSGKVGS